VTLVRAAAEGLGFVVFLANIEYCVSTQVWDSDYYDHSDSPDYDRDEYPHGRDYDCKESPYQRGRVHAKFDDNDDICATISLSKVFDLSGHVVLEGPKCSIKIGDDCFLPRDALDDEYPDDRNEFRDYVSLHVKWTYKSLLTLRLHRI
jgi:hypothetical protein